MDDQAAGQIRLRSKGPLKSHWASQAGGVEQTDQATGHRLQPTPAGTEDQHQQEAGLLEGNVEGTGQSGGCGGGS
eukprot:1874684-Alexandrium_andersonii.AAC.1